MAKGNPIVGLAYVVTSQQEMLEEANKKNDELTKEYMDVLKEKEQLEYTTFNCERGDIPMHEVEDVFRIYEGRIKELIEMCNSIKAEYDTKVEALEAENDARIEEMNRTRKELKEAQDHDRFMFDEWRKEKDVNGELKEKIQMYEQGKLFHWQKFEPNEDGRMLIPWGHKHANPSIDGLYHYSNEHNANFYDEVTHEKIHVKNCFGIGYVASTVDNGNLYIFPNGDKGATLIGFSVRYIDDYLLMDELPEELQYNENICL